jgi:hypothetical protein
VQAQVHGRLQPHPIFKSPVDNASMKLANCRKQLEVAFANRGASLCGAVANGPSQRAVNVNASNLKDHHPSTGITDLALQFNHPHFTLKVW